MNNEKWMPPKPEFTSMEPKFIYESDFDTWYSKEIRPLFENAEEVLGNVYPIHSFWKLNPYSPDTNLHKEYDAEHSHTALIINIKRIQKEDSASGLAKELEKYLSDEYTIFVSCEIPRTLIDRIKSYLEKTKKDE